MQHNVGSWYIPWNMGVPLQKVLTVPFHPSGQITGAPVYPHHQPQIATAAVQHQQSPQSSQQQCSTPPSPQQTYQQQLTSLQHHSPMHHQPMHPATAAMFTPLAIRSFVTHPHHGFQHLSQQQQQQLSNVQTGTNVVNGSHRTSTLQHSSNNNQQSLPQTLSPNIANHHQHSHAAALRQHHAQQQHNNILQASSLMTIPSMKKVKET